MTIATRNRFITVALALTTAILVAAIACFIIILAKAMTPEISSGIRPIAFTSKQWFATYSPLATLLSILILPSLALAILVYILIFFEKTHTTEITFFAVCAFALALESARLLIPLYSNGADSIFILISVSRLVFFSRFLILLVLLAGAIFANGMLMQQIGPGLFILAFFSFSLANSVPINTSSITSNFLALSGYNQTIQIIYMLLGVMTVATYYILGTTRAIENYRQAAFGMLLLIGGYLLLMRVDTWITFVPSALLLLTGTRIYLKSIHNYYLWQ